MLQGEANELKSTLSINTTPDVIFPNDESDKQAADSLATVTPSAIPSFMRISAYNESGNNIVISDNTEETLNQLTMTLRGLTSTVKGLNNTIMAAMGKVGFYVQRSRSFSGSLGSWIKINNYQFTILTSHTIEDRMKFCLEI